MSDEVIEVVENSAEAVATPVPDPVALPELDTEEAFQGLVEALLQSRPIRLGETLVGTISAIEPEHVVIRLGSEGVGRVDRSEFIGPDGVQHAAVGDEVVVFVDAKVEGQEAEVWQLSKEKADRLREWDRLFDAFKNKTVLEGVVTGLVPNGLSVDIGVRALVPNALIDVRPPRNPARFVGQKLSFRISRFDRKAGTIVLSRRELLEAELSQLRAKTLETLRVGATVRGTVKNLTDYGCFVDLGGIDGLLHVTDLSWGRVGHASEVVQPGQELTLQVLQMDADGGRVKLGLKQLTPDPWLDVDRRYRNGQRVSGRVQNLAEFGAFVELDGGLEGLIHVSQLSWTKRVRHPSEVLTKGAAIDAIVLEIDKTGRRIALGYKQTQANPWVQLQDAHPVGSRVRAPVRSVTNFGVFLGLAEGVDGMVHVSDLSWGGQVKDPRDAYKPGDEVEAVVLNIDVEGERVALGVKQLERDPWYDIEHRFPIGQVVEGQVIKLLEFGAIVRLEENIEGLVHISELSDERVESVGAVLKEGETVRAKVISLVPEQRKMGLSVKRAQEVEAVTEPAPGKSAPPKRLTIGDLIKEKMGNATLPPGKPPTAP